VIPAIIIFVPAIFFESIKRAKFDYHAALLERREIGDMPVPFFGVPPIQGCKKVDGNELVLGGEK
jgi:hypothetical protein